MTDVDGVLDALSTAGRPPLAFLYDDTENAYVVLAFPTNTYDTLVVDATDFTPVSFVLE